MAPTNDTLSQVPFLRNLAASFHVDSIPLAIFLLILVCIACIVALVLIILCVKSCMRRAYIRKPKRKGLKMAYLDDILGPVSEPGMCGLLTYSLEYDVSSKCLRVGLIEAKDLTPTTDSKTLDAYASVQLAMKSGPTYKMHGPRHKTDVHRHTTVPRWHYTCEYTVTESEMKNAILIIEVFDYDNLCQDRRVGRLEVDISAIDMSEYVGTTLEKTEALKPGAPRYKGVGEICVGAAYLSNAGCIEVFIYEARKLEIGHRISPGKDCIFVHVEAKYKNRTLGTYETKTKVDTINPYFNEKFVFNVKAKYLDSATIVCTLKKRGAFGRQSSLARAVIGARSAWNTGEKQWDEMRTNSPRTHVMWHVLVPQGTEIEP